MTQVKNQNTAMQAVTLSASTASIAFTPTSFMYMTNGTLHYASSLTSPVGLAPAFAASTAYFAGDMIIQSGVIYQAKVDFTSGAAFVATDWYTLDNNTITTGKLRLYVLFVRYTKSTGVTALVLRCGPQITDTFNDDGSGLSAALANLDQKLGEPTLSLRVSEDKWTRSMAKIGYLLVRNQSGSDFVPGTTALSAVYTYFFSAIDYNSD